MAIPSKQIGWSNESNLLWGIAKQLNQLNGIMGSGACCGGGSGCITHTDITWDALNAGNAAGTLQDCFYNVIDRPNSGTDPLYVLAEGGRVDLDNEVVRQQAAVGSLCVDSLQEGLGCFNIYAESTSYTVEYVPGVEVIRIRLDANLCSDTTFAIGDTVTQIDPVSIPTPTGTIVFIGANKLDGNGCVIYVEVTSGTWDAGGTLTNGVDEIGFDYIPSCNDYSPLAVGTEVIAIQALPTDPPPTGTITAISGTTITITPTSGDWSGVVVFAAIDEENTCYYTLTAPIVGVSVQLNSETVCWDADSYLGRGVYMNTLMQASNGLIYGTLQNSYCPQDVQCIAAGQLFSLDPVTNVATVLFEFTNLVNTGISPNCNVVEVGGFLYGTTVQGGLYDDGTIWSWEIATNTFTKLHDINDGDEEGVNPYNGLVNVGGVLYGVCEVGGANGSGTIFSYDTTTNTFYAEDNFGGEPDGRPAYPQGTLVEVNPGELWGTSYAGGVGNQGTVYKYTISSGFLEVVINLDDVNGDPYGASGGVSLGSDGNVYFNTQNGGYADGGTICQIYDVATTPTLNVLYEFDYDVEGGYTDAVCPIYIDGDVYGVTVEAGANGYGTMYKLNVSSGFFTKLHDFTFEDGVYSYCGLLLQVGNELFGMNNWVGCQEEPCTQTYGNIFKYNIATDVYTNVHALNTQAQSSSTVATSICASITNPDYLCHTVGNCVYIDGPAGENGYTLVLKTVVTYEWCRKDDVGNCDPTVGDHLHNDDDLDNPLIGTILTSIVTSIDGPNICGTMTVELADNDYNPPPPFIYYVDETGCAGIIEEVTGSTLSYEVTPFAGGFSPVNLPCYYNVPFDVITEYPLSQKLTKAEIDYLVVNSLLIPGTSYRIMDVDFFLYGGTEIVIQAVAPDKFSDIGMGKFYTPRYNQEIAGYGIWDAEQEGAGFYAAGDTAIWGGLVWTFLDAAPPPTNAPSAYNLDYTNWSIPGRIRINISAITGTFTVGDAVYGWDSAFQGVITEVGTDFLIVMAPPSFFAYPIWEPSHIIYDDNTGAEATMDSVTLHTDYFSDLIYNVRWDEIKYDYANDFISYRKDNSGNNVNQERWEYDDWGAVIYRNILGMQWGNDFNDDIYVGVGSNTVIGIGYVEIINFKGGIVTGNTFNNSNVYNNTFAISGSSAFSNNTMLASTFLLGYIGGDSSFLNNLISSSTIIYFYANGPAFISNTITNNSFFDFSNTGSLPGSIYLLNANNAYLNQDISAATIIYGNYSRDLISNQSNVAVLRYINTINVQIITAVTT